MSVSLWFTLFPLLDLYMYRLENLPVLSYGGGGDGGEGVDGGAGGGGGGSE